MMGEWVRAWRNLWTSESMFELSPHAKLLRMIMRDMVRREDEHGAGWLEIENGGPITGRALGRLLGLDDAQLENSLSELRTQSLIEYDGQRFSLPGWSREQDRHCPRSATARGCAVSSVYFIQAGASGPIKIGVSVDPISRMAQMQTGMPETLRLLAFIAGTRDDERKLHIKLAAHRIRGEWFHPHQDVLGALRIS